MNVPTVGEIVPSLLESPVVGDNEVRGTVVAIDHFGNLITNIDGQQISRFRLAEVQLAGRRVPLHRTYGEQKPGDYLALVNSFGVVEIARAEGHAADGLGMSRGAPVLVTNIARN